MANKLLTLAFVVCIAICICNVSRNKEAITYKSDAMSSKNCREITGTKVKKQVINITDIAVTKETVEKQPKAYSLDVKTIYQKPELPTGCEVTSLAMVLDYIGYSVTKTDLADKYLKKAKPYADKTFNDAFMGSPYESTGWGCYSPVIVDTASKYLKEIGEDKEYKAVDISGASIEDIAHNIWLGNPVIAWVTINFDDSTDEEHFWTTPSGEKAKFTSGEHCVVVTGYDIDKHELTINDPLSGIVHVKTDKFIRVYNKLHKQAVILEKSKHKN